MTIVIPMAGDGQRFKDAGYDLPKPLIDVCGKPMIQRVLENLPQAQQTVLVTRKEHNIPDKYGTLIELEEKTQGAVETILKARDYITDGPLMIANCDQLVWPKFQVPAFGNIISTFPATSSAHSYIEVDDFGAVTNIVEKPDFPPSNEAVAGVYYFESGTEFLSAADSVIDRGETDKGEFYVSTVIKEMINRSISFFRYFEIAAMIGTPAELQHFQMAYRLAKEVL